MLQIVGYVNVNERLAWEISQLNIETKYLSDFLKGLKYVGAKIPDEGQSERLMLKYFNYFWEIRSFLKTKYNISVLENLEEFQLNTDTIDEKYYEMVASSICAMDLSSKTPSSSRYYIQKKIPFFVNGERYFEITLQLAGLYATKFNRITVYSKKDISSNYSIQIAYDDAEITLLGTKSRIKVVTDWKVSIDPRCLNKLGKILKIDIKLSINYGEYNALMKFLTSTGMNLLDLINMHENSFHNILNVIYGRTNTDKFKNVLIKLRKEYWACGHFFRPLCLYSFYNLED